MPTLALTPFQWVRKLKGDQIFNSLQVFQLFQNDPLDNTNSQMAFSFHLLGCNKLNLKIIFIKVGYINYCIGHQSANIYILYIASIG